MNLDDKRDVELGALLRRAAETVVEAAAPVRTGLPLPADGRHTRFNPRRFRARIAGTAALAAGLAAALLVPALVRHRVDRELLSSAAVHLSRSLIRESSSFLAELPAASELEAAAADWAGSLFPADAGL